jgi:hypothetical protein
MTARLDEQHGRRTDTMSTATELPIYDRDTITLGQVRDLAEGRALLRDRDYDPEHPDDPDTRPQDLALDQEHQATFAAAIARNCLDYVFNARQGYRLESLWRLYCGVDGEERPRVILDTDPNRGTDWRNVLRHKVTINYSHLGLMLPPTALGRLEALLSPFADRRLDRNLWRYHSIARHRGYGLIRFHVRDSQLDAFRDFMPALVDLIQETGGPEEPDPYD